MRKKTPEMIVSEVVLNTLRGLRLSKNPLVAGCAALREQAEIDHLEALTNGGRRKRKAA